MIKLIQAPGGFTPAGSNNSIMIIAAHPDDTESWCAGTLALSIAQGVKVKLLLVTSGDKGSSNPDEELAEVSRRREAEAQHAADILGLAEVRFLRYADGEVENTLGLRRDLVEWIRRWQPHHVFTHDPQEPWPPYVSHRDHRTVGRAALDAIYPLARDPLTFKEHYLESGLAPHAVSQVWLFATNQPEYAVDIEEGFERKLAARLAHVSQTVSANDLERTWRDRAAHFGLEVGVSLAETFVVLHLD